MTGDTENEFEHPGDSPSPEEAQASSPGPDEPRRPSRRFAAWGAAHKREEEPGPSLLKRASAGFRRLFGRKAEPAAESSDEAASDEPASDEPVLEWNAADSSSPEEPVVSERTVEYADEPVAAEAAADETKEDLKFLWAPDESVASAEVAPPQDAPAEPISYDAASDDAAAPVLEAEVEVQYAPIDERLSTGVPRSLLDDVPEPKKKSFFARLFSARSKPATPEPDLEVAAEVPPDETPVEVGADDSRFAPQAGDFEEVSSAVDAAALDDALPMEPAEEDAVAGELDRGATLAESVDASEAPASKKRGFFARLMGRAKEEEPPVEDMAPEGTAPDTPEAIEVAGEVFDAARNEFVPEQADADAFASVDDALPVEDQTQFDGTPPTEPIDISAIALSPTEPIDVSAVTQPPTEPIDVSAYSQAPPPEDASPSYLAMPVYDFDAPKPDAAAGGDAGDAPPADVDARSTMEVDLPSAQADDSRPTAEVSADMSAEIVAHAGEEDRDTDEFEQIDLDATVVEDSEKTAEVAREPGFFQKLFGKTKEVTQVEPAVQPPPTANPNFLVQKFRTFYNELVIYKSQKAELTAGFATAIVTSYDADLSPEQSANSLAVRLQQMLELQLAESSWMGGESHDLYPEAQYAMAVLADEMLTHVEWPGQAAWGAHRLEITVFKTAASDVEFFKRVDRLLKNGPQTPGTRDLARVYLLTIASGFRGKYRPFGLSRPLAEYRRRLYEFVYGGDALLLYGDDRRIFPEATSVTVAGKGVRRVSMAQQWAAILVLLLAGYTIVSHITWNRVSAELKDIANRVEQARTATTTPDSPNGGGGR